MASLMAWVMRPQPTLRQAIERYGVDAGLGVPGGAARALAVHIRHGDKAAVGERLLGGERWRTSVGSFSLWSRRLAADLGLTRALVMSDDVHAIHQLVGPPQQGPASATAAPHATQPRSFFHLVPAPLACMPLAVQNKLGVGEAAVLFTQVA